MSHKSGIFNNDLKQTDSLMTQNDSAKEKEIQQGIFSEEDPTLKSAFQPPEINSPPQFNNPNFNNSVKIFPPTESWPTKFGLISKKLRSNKLLIFLLNFCLPVGGSNDKAGSSDQCDPVMICLPCQPNFIKAKKQKEEVHTKFQRKPVGLVTRCKEMELNNGKIIFGCLCGKRNGLGGEGCPRSCCLNNPGCFMTPPQCWPQFKEPPKPPIIPERKMICIPIELVYDDSPPK